MCSGPVGLGAIRTRTGCRRSGLASQRLYGAPVCSSAAENPLGEGPRSRARVRLDRSVVTASNARPTVRSGIAAFRRPRRRQPLVASARSSAIVSDRHVHPGDDDLGDLARREVQPVDRRACSSAGSPRCRRRGIGSRSDRRLPFTHHWPFGARRTDSRRSPCGPVGIHLQSPGHERRGVDDQPEPRRHGRPTRRPRPPSPRTRGCRRSRSTRP